MTFCFHPEAQAEFYEALAYYEECEPGLGCDFALEVHSTIRSIVAHPWAWPTLEDEVRRCLTRRFPYGVLYSIESDGIFILAVMHLHRSPDYWKHRQESG
ncbi:MAG: type II toxin-antitoxin system RelE/ParE family toxin [Planctomycetes bacterium]|nr:type II toxin-antitoxin system RelE/ParE family toxin [Planctomycetota bacterium]